MSADWKDLPLPKQVLDILESRHARRNSEPSAQLEELLRGNEYEPNGRVAAFEVTFGGIMFPDDDADDDWESGEDGGWMVGAALCLAEGGHTAPRGGEDQAELGLIPIIYSPNDIIYFMDPDGRCWGQDTIEEPEAQPCAKDGETLLARLVLETLLWGPDAKRVEKKGLHGDALAKEKGFVPVPGASDEYSRWWAGPSGYIAEYEESGELEARTLFVTLDMTH